jgi:hypothetical protein
MITRVISALRMKGSTLDEWQRLPKIGNTLGTLNKLCPAFGIGPLLKGGWVYNARAGSHRICRPRPPGGLWEREASPGWHGRWRSHGHWIEDCTGLWQKPNKDNWEQESPPQATTDIQ